MTAGYHVDRVSRHYGTVRALDDVSLTITPGHRLGVVGESGSGKSTLLRLLAGLDQPTDGTVTYDGRPVSGVPDRRLGFLRHQVQVVFQDPRSSLNPRMKVGDIVAEPLRSRWQPTRLSRSAARQRVHQVLDEVGLPTHATDRYPHEFSGGQRQRIAIARALAPDPSVLLADEPVSALDVSVRAQVLNLLTDLVDRRDLTLVFVSHDLAVVRHLCADVVVLRAGQIVDSGPTEQIWQHPTHEYTRELLAAIPQMRTAPPDVATWD